MTEAVRNILFLDDICTRLLLKQHLSVARLHMRKSRSWIPGVCWIWCWRILSKCLFNNSAQCTRICHTNIVVYICIIGVFISKLIANLIGVCTCIWSIITFVLAKQYNSKTDFVTFYMKEFQSGLQDIKNLSSIKFNLFFLSPFRKHIYNKYTKIIYMDMYECSQ